MRRLLLAVAVLLVSACDDTGRVNVNANIEACDVETDWSTRAAACTIVTRATSVPAEQRATAFLNRGAARANLGEQTRAIADFGRALRLNPSLAAAYFERALVHHNHGDFASAVADYDHALALDPNLTAAAERRNLALTQRVDDFATLLERANALIATDPQNAANWNNRCWVRAVEGVELQAALLDCNESLRLTPADPQTLDSRGLVYLKLGNAQAAFRDYDEAVRLAPQEAHFLYGRGLARLGRGEQAEGEADLQAAIAIDAGIADTYAAYALTPAAPVGQSATNIPTKK